MFLLKMVSSNMRVFTLFILFVFLAFPVTIYAQPSLFFAPTRVEITHERPVKEIRVTNTSDFARSYNLSIENIAMGENGVTVRVENFDYSAKRMLRFVPRQFDIEPGGKQIIRIMARFPEGTEDGEYHAHLEFLENVQKREELNAETEAENRARMKAEISYAAAIPVIISKGEIKTTVSMKDLFLTTNEQGNKMLNLTLFREGNGQGNALVEADYIAPDGTEMSAASRRTVFIYRELNRRIHSYVLERLNETTLQKGGQIRVKLYNRNISDKEPVDTLFVPIE